MLACPLTAQAKTVTLSWDASPSPSVIGYSVITSTLPSMLNPSTQDVGAVLTTIVNGLENQDDYYFCVKAYGPPKLIKRQPNRRVSVALGFDANATFFRNWELVSNRLQQSCIFFRVYRKIKLVVS